MRKTSVGGIAVGLSGALWSALRILSRASWVPPRVRATLYRASHQHPNAHVSDDVLADRVRSTLGPVQKRLGVDRINVTVENGTVTLRGTATAEQARALEAEARSIAGVRDVRSHFGG